MERTNTNVQASNGGMSNKIGIAIVLLLSALLVVSIVWISGATNGGNGGSGSATATGAVTSMSFQGFSSEAEMMEAHHGKGAASGASAANSGSGGCGGVPENPQGHDGVSVKNGELSKYGISYDNAGYEKLVAAVRGVSLSAAQTATIVGLNVEISCCGVKTLQASGNCECGHHQALFGLAKILAAKGYARAEIQQEINKWKAVFFPSGGSGNTGGC